MIDEDEDVHVEKHTCMHMLGKRLPSGRLLATAHERAAFLFRYLPALCHDAHLFCGSREDEREPAE